MVDSFSKIPKNEKKFEMWAGGPAGSKFKGIAQNVSNVGTHSPKN